MGIPVLVLGESGSGKSCSLRNFEPGEVGVFNVAGKALPFRKKLPQINNAGYQIIMRSLSAPKLKTYVIDDSQYLLCFDMFNRAKEVGYNKFTDLALNFYNLIQQVIRGMPPDCIVYFLHHTETIDDKVKAKTIGKMLDEKLTVEGLFSIVLLCATDGTNHEFITQSDGHTTAKSPMDMFPLKMDNDLKAVDATIRSYYEM
ncbi:MAG: hypothetical protein ACI4Q6_09585 [Huintestinicola sp.]